MLQIDTHQVLADPIQSKLRANHCDYVIARQCFEAAHKGQLKGEAKAIRVPRGRMIKSHCKPSPFTRKSVMSQSNPVCGL